MGQQPFQDVLDSINARLSAREVIRLIGFRPDGLTQVGTRLKGYCPVHRGDTFKSLQVDEQTRTCQCIVRDCAAYESRTLIELYSLATGQSLMEGALALASQLSIPLPSGAQEAITHHHATVASQLFTSGKMEEGIAAQRIALAASPEREDLLGALAAALEESGDTRAAAELWMSLVERLESLRPSAAIKVLEEQVLRLQPGNADAQARFARLLQEHAPSDTRWVAFRRTRAQALVSAGSHAEAITEYEAILTALGEDPAFLHEYGEALHEEGRDGEAVAYLDKAVRLLKSAKDYSGAAHVARRILELEPGDETHRLRFARLSAQAGQPEVFQRELLSLVRLALNRDDTDRAEELLLELIQEVGEDIEALRVLAEIADKRGDRDAQADYVLKVAELTPVERLSSTLDEVLALEPQDVSQLARLATLLDKAERVTEALDVYTRAVIIYVALQEEVEARALLKRLGQRDAGNRERSGNILSHLLELDQKRLASEYILEIARELMRLGQNNEAADLLEEGLRRCGPLEELERPAVRLLREMQSRDRLTPVMFSAWDRLIRFDRFSEAESMINEALETFPGDPTYLEKLADLMLMTDRLEEGRAVLMEISESSEAPLDLRIRAVEHAVELDLGDYDSLLFLSQLLEERGDRGRAATVCHQAAELLLDEGEIQQALGVIERASSLVPDDLKLRELAAEVALRSGDEEKAVELFVDYARAAATAEPERARDTWRRLCEKLPEASVLRLAFVDWLLANDAAHDAAGELVDLAELEILHERRDEAMLHFRRALELAPDNHKVRMQNARLLMQDEARAEEAIELLRAAAKAAREADRVEDEVEAAESLVVLGALDGQANLRLADQLESLGRRYDALQRVRAALPEIAGDERLATLERLFRLGETAMALREEYAALLEAEDCLPEAAAQLAELAQTHESRADARKAVALLRRASELDRTNLDVRLRLLRILQILGQWVEAEEIAPSLGEALARVGRHEDIRTHYMPLIAKRPGNPRLHVVLGGALMELGDNGAATEAFTQAAGLHEASGEIEQAAEALTRLVELAPDNLAAREHRAALLRRSGRIDEARDAYLELLDRIDAKEQPELLASLVRDIESISYESLEEFRRLTDWLDEHGESDTALESWARFASEAEERGDFVQALDASAVLLEKRPHDIELAAQRGVILAGLGRMHEAEQAFADLAPIVRETGDSLLGIVSLERGLELLPSSEPIHRLLLEFYLASGDVTSASRVGLSLIERWHQQERNEEAALLAEVLLVAMPERVDIALLRADILLEDGRGQAATEGLREYAAAHRTQRPELAQRAYSYIVDHFAESSEDLATLSELVLRNEGVEAARPLQQRALELLARQTFDNDDFKALAGGLVAADPGNHALRERYVDLLMERGERDAAHDQASSLARDLHESEEWSEAIRMARRALDILPDLETRIVLAQYLESGGMAAEAEETWIIVAEKHRDRGEGPERVAALREALRLSPDSHTSRVLLADALAECPEEAGEGERFLLLTSAAEQARVAGNVVSSVALFEKALLIKPEDAEVIEALATALDELGRSDEAADMKLRLVRSLIAREDLGAALAVADAALAKRPDLSELRGERLRLLATQGNLPRYAEEVKDIARGLLDGHDSARAAETLADGAEALLARKAAHLATDLLSGFTELVEDIPALGELLASGHEERGEAAVAAERWSRLAARHRKAGESAASERCLRRAVGLQPEDPMHRSALVAILQSGGDQRREDLLIEIRALAGLLEEKSEPTTAMATWRELLRVEPLDIEALSRVLALERQVGDPEEARSIGFRLGELLVERSLFDQAEDVYTSLVNDKEGRPSALRSLMNLYEATDNLVGHLSVARELAEHFDSQQLLEDANAIHERIAERHPNDLESRERLAEYHAQSSAPEIEAQWLVEVGRAAIHCGALEKAAEALTRAGKLLPKSPKVPEQFATLYEKLQDIPEATSNLLSAATLYREADDPDASLAALDRLLALEPYSAPAHEMRADLYGRKGDKTAAVRELELLAHFYQSAELVAEEAGALQRILEHHPDSHGVRERYAMLLGALEREGEAVTELLTLANARLAEDDRAGAIEFMETAVALDPDDPRCYERLVELYIADGQTEEADEAALWLVDHYTWSNRWEQATHYLMQAPSLPMRGELQLRLAELWRERENPEEVRKALQRALGLLDGKPAARRQALLGLFELDPDRHDLYEQLVHSALEMHNVREVVDLTRRAADALLKEGEIESARHLFVEAAALIPNNTELHGAAGELFIEHGIPELGAASLLAQAKILQASGRGGDALPIIARALGLKPGDVPLLLLKTRILVDRGDYEDALPDALVVLDLLGERDQIQPALDLAEELVSHLPQSVDLRARLARLLALRQDVAAQATQLREMARLYTEQGQAGEAAETLRGLLLIMPDDTRARTRYIELAAELGNEREAIPDYMALAAKHARGGAVVEAARLYRRVMELDPTQFDTGEDLVRLLLADNRLEEAIAEATRLAARLVDARQGRRAVDLLLSLNVKDGTNAAYHEALGKAHLSTNSRGQAMREWRQAVSILQKGGSSADTARIIGEMLAIDPFNLEIRQQLIESQLAAGLVEEAMTAMQELGERYLERGLCDLAEAEARRIIEMDFQRVEAWQLLFKAALALGDERELIADYLEYAEILARRGDLSESLDYYLKVMTLDPKNLRAHRGYVTQYPKVGKHREIVEEILAFAQLLVENGEVDDAVRYFELVMSIDPSNLLAREMLSATQGSGGDGSSQGPPSDVFRIPTIDGEGRHDSSFDSRLSESQRNFLREKALSASDYLEGTLSAIDRQESEEALAQVVANYRTILAANAQNAQMRIKLADILEQMGRIPEMLQELFIASETLFHKGELGACVIVCERYLSHQPADGRMRKRLSEAVVKRDAMKALESAISYYGDESSGDRSSRS
ncbi:tetratricopeptide repeat protein [bacterium]|nr:tetratricopeptide repeat protein [bacterium]